MNMHGIPVIYHGLMESGVAMISRDPWLNPRREPIVIYVRGPEDGRLLAQRLNEMQGQIDDCIDRLELRSMGIDPR